MSSKKPPKKKAIIAIYKRLLKQDRVHQFGAAFHRMRELEKLYKQETRWYRDRLNEDDVNTSLDWLKENLN